MNAELIVMCGVPGSGKSTYATTMFRNSHIIVCADDYRRVYTGKDFHRPAERMVYTMVSVTVEVMLKQCRPVVIDMTSFTAKDRRKWIEMARRCGVPVKCVWMISSVNRCLDLNQRREKIVPEDVIRTMHLRFAPPTESEGFHEIIRVEE